MKIALVANTCWNIYNFRKGLVHHFLVRGEVIVLAPKDEYTGLIQNWGVTWIETPMDGTGANPIKDFRYFSRLIKAFKVHTPDVVLSFTIKSNIYSSLAGRLTSIPVIANVSGLGTVFLVRGIVGKMAILLYRIAFRSCSFIFFQNDEDKEYFTSIISVDPRRTGVLPGSGINLNEFQPAPFVAREQTKFLMIARIIIEKGVREYAEAASQFTDYGNVSFTLIGKFDASHARSVGKEELDRWIANGWVDYRPHSDQIAQVITDHDAIILPSYREGTPRTLLEGAALGKPLLASDVPGCKGVVRDGYNGFLFEVKNAKSMVDKIKLFLSLNKEERMQLAANSRTLVEDTYDESKVIDMYGEVIHRIIAGA